MKKLFLLLVMTVAICGSAEAQKGMSGVGLNAAANYADGLSMGVGGKYQYNASDFIRLEPSFSYYFVGSGPHDDSFSLAALMNTHVFILSPRVLRPYVFAGIGYVVYKENYSYGDPEKDGSFGINGGLGLDWRISHKLSLQIEAGPLYGIQDDDMFGARASIGFCYNF